MFIRNAYRKVVISVNLRGQPDLYGVRFSSYGFGAKKAKKGPKKAFPQKNISYDFFLVIVDIIGSNLVKKSNCFIRLQGSDIFIQILGGLFGESSDTIQV